MSSTSTVRFGLDDWAKGHRGLRNAHDTERCSIQELMLYSNGLLGPRPAWQNEVTLSTSLIQNTRIFQARYNFGFSSSPNAEGFLAISDGRAEFFEYGTTTAYATKIAAGIGDGIDPYSTVTQITDVMWLVHGTVVTLSGPAPADPRTITTVDAGAALDTRFMGAASLSLDGSTVHQGRAFFWGSKLVGSAYEDSNRVYYSDSVIVGGATAYQTFTSADQFFDVDGTVRGCVSIGASLFIWTEDGAWTIMQGSGDPANATFNSLGVGRIPQIGRVPVRIDNTALFTSSDGMSLVVMGAGGQQDDKTLGHLGISGTGSDTSNPQGSANSLLNNVCIPRYGGGILETRFSRNGVWYREIWSSVADVSYGWQIDVGGLDYFDLLAWFDNTASAWKVSQRFSTAEGPPLSIAGDHSEFAETPTGILYLPRIFQSTKQVRVKRVVVDGVIYVAGDFYETPAVSVDVWDGTASHPMTIGPGSTPLTDPGSGTKNVRLVFTPTDGPHPHNRFVEVGLSGMKGLSIEAVTVEYETSEGPITV